MLSLPCVVSALTQTQAGGVDLLFRFASSVQSCCGEGGALQAAVAVCGEQVWRSLHGRTAPFPSAAPARAAGQVSGSLQTGPGACLPGGRGWLLWG